MYIIRLNLAAEGHSLAMCFFREEFSRLEERQAILQQRSLELQREREELERCLLEIGNGAAHLEELLRLNERLDILVQQQQILSHGIRRHHEIVSRYIEEFNTESAENEEESIDYTDISDTDID